VPIDSAPEAACALDGSAAHELSVPLRLDPKIAAFFAEAATAQSERPGPDASGAEAAELPIAAGVVDPAPRSNPDSPDGESDSAIEQESAALAPAELDPRVNRTIIRQFLLWARSAPADHRADAVDALARAVLQSDLSREDHDEAELALLAMLDDPVPAVRRTIAAAIAAADTAPRAVLSSLLEDRTEVAAPVLERSPILSDAELVDQAALRDLVGQCAIARRATISPGLAGALAEVGALSAVETLLANPGACLTEGSLRRIDERFGHEPSVREILLRRPDLSIEIRLLLASALANQLNGMAARAGGPAAERIEQRTREAFECTVVVMASDLSPDLTRRMVAHLRAAGHLTPGLILRAALSARLRFVEAAFAELTGLGSRRLAAILRQGGAARDALCKSAGLPESVRPALLAVVPTLYDEAGEEDRPGLSRRLIGRALAASTEQGTHALAALLERLAAEAAREEARRLTRTIVAEAEALELTTDDLSQTASPTQGRDAEGNAARTVAQAA